MAEPQDKFVPFALPANPASTGASVSTQFDTKMRAHLARLNADQAKKIDYGEHQGRDVNPVTGDVKILNTIDWQREMALIYMVLKGAIAFILGALLYNLFTPKAHGAVLVPPLTLNNAAKPLVATTPLNAASEKPQQPAKIIQSPSPKAALTAPAYTQLLPTRPRVTYARGRVWAQPRA